MTGALCLPTALFSAAAPLPDPLPPPLPRGIQAGSSRPRTPTPASALAAIKRPYILCCVFPPAGFMGWRIDFTMCLQQHETHGVTVGAHNCAVFCFQKRVQFFFRVCFFFRPRPHTHNTDISAKKGYMYKCVIFLLYIYIIFYDIDFLASQVLGQAQCAKTDLFFTW